MFVWRFTLIVLCGLLSLGAGRARGRESADPHIVEAAAKHFTFGVGFFRRANWDAARVEFEAAYALTKAADLLHNLSLVAERQGHLAEAMAFEQQFRASKGQGLSAAERGDVEQRLVEIQGQLPEPPPAVSVPSADEAAAALAQRSASSGRRPPPLAVALLGGGGVLLAVGIGCGIGALLTARSIESGDLYQRDLPVLFSRGQSLDRAGITFDLLGTAALAGGVVLSIVHRVRSAEHSRR